MLRAETLEQRALTEHACGTEDDDLHDFGGLQHVRWETPVTFSGQLEQGMTTANLLLAWAARAKARNGRAAEYKVGYFELCPSVRIRAQLLITAFQ